MFFSKVNFNSIIEFLLPVELESEKGRSVLHVGIKRSLIFLEILLNYEFDGYKISTAI